MSTYSEQSLPGTRKDDSAEKIISEGNKLKKANSWDCSSSSAKEMSPKERHSDWDLSSGCHETMVEPFEDKFKENMKNPDAEDQDHVEKKNSVTFKKTKTKSTSFASSLESNPESLSLSLPDTGGNKKHNLFDIYTHLSGNNSQRDNSLEDESGKKLYKREEDSLLLEDLEEFLKDKESSECARTDKSVNSTWTDDLKEMNETLEYDSKQNEGTLDDTTIRMITKSGRSQSTISDSKYIERSNKLNVFIKKAKSYSSPRKKNKMFCKTSRSDNISSIEFQNINMNSLLLNCKKKALRNLETKPPEKPNNFDQARKYFTEYECRMMTTDKGSERNISSTSMSGSNNNETDTQVNDNETHDASQIEPQTEEQSTSEEKTIPGSSMPMSLEVVSLPDIIGRNNLNDRTNKEKITRRISGPGKMRTDTSEDIQTRNKTNKVTESWFLLDDQGQYREVTREEVTILLNGRSAEAVLQTYKEHFIQSANLTDTNSQNTSLNGLITKESIQNILREEDPGGEGEDKAMISLERKVENTLLYIQPSANLTASIKIIPVDTEMIHIWRRSRDNSSLLSSEVDLRLQGSQDSVENSIQRNPYDHHNILRRITIENPQQTVAEQDESLVERLPSSGTIVPTGQENQVPEFSKLLIETRMIVDNLAKSFKLLQTRLDGETSKSSILQEEVTKLRELLKKPFERLENAASKREIIFSKTNLNESVSSVWVTNKYENENDEIRNEENENNHVENDEVEKNEIDSNEVENSENENNEYKNIENENKNTIEGSTNDPNDFEVEPINESDRKYENEDKNIYAGQPIQELVATSTQYRSVQISSDGMSGNNQASSGYITVNIYTSEDNWPGIQETNSVVQANLGIIEGKMKRLQEENEIVSQQNSELRKKLKDISQELEKYLATTNFPDVCFDEDRETDTLRDQVCNLKLELDNLKKTKKVQERELKAENALMREQLARSLQILQEWLTASECIVQEIKNSKSKLAEGGIWNDNSEYQRQPQDPSHFLQILNSFIENTTERLLMVQNKNLLCQTVETAAGDDYSQKLRAFDKIVSEQKADPNNSNEQVMEDYFTVIVEKASLTEEIKILKTENEMLMQSQVEHYEKLKQTMLALKERKDEISALRSNQILTEKEKNHLKEALKVFENEKAIMEKEISEKEKLNELLAEEKKEKIAELEIKHNELQAALAEIVNFQISFSSKDKIIKDYELENEQLLRKEENKTNQIEVLKEEINNLEKEKNQLESEISSIKSYMNESHREMTEYINHLETIVNNTQEALDKNKQKIKEKDHILSGLKMENEALDKKYQCELKLYNKTKIELEKSNEALLHINNKYRELDEEKERMNEKFNSLKIGERNILEALDAAKKDKERLEAENNELNRELEVLSKNRDETLKDQNSLFEKFLIVTKELQKLQEKYRYVKAECNERTNVIKHLEKMLRESIVDYNKRIAFLENNITRILDKIAACKDSMRENRGSSDAEVKELRQQLNIIYQEREELENMVNNYYSTVKHLENELEDKNKKMEEINVKLSEEKRKGVESESKIKIRCASETITRENSLELQRIEKLENEIAVAENELADCQGKLKRSESHHESERKKLELIIVNLRSEISKYEMRMGVLMKNITNQNKVAEQNEEKKCTEDVIKKVQAINIDLEAKNKKIAQMNEIINKFRTDVKMKENDLENSKKKNAYISQIFKDLQAKYLKMEEALSLTNKNMEKQQQEKTKIAEKLLQSVKIIMEEKSARQTAELLAVEKEKTMKEQLQQLKNELEMKTKSYNNVFKELSEKKKMINKLQFVMKKIKEESTAFKSQLTKCQQMNVFYNSENSRDSRSHQSNSLTQVKLQNFSPERLDSCLKELKEIRDVNLCLRKTEGVYQAKIVRLEDEIREARMLIKELEGNIKIEKKTRKAFKNMIVSAKMEIEKCLMTKQIVSTVADKIIRHLSFHLENLPRGIHLPQTSDSEIYN